MPLPYAATVCRFGKRRSRLSLFAQHASPPADSLACLAPSAASRPTAWHVWPVRRIFWKKKKPDKGADGMGTAGTEWGQFFTLLLMAIALGMDAFSLGIGMGMKGIRLLDIVKYSVTIALFHVLMPLMGMFMGQYVGTLLGGVAVAVGGALLVVLGAHMIYSALRGDSVQSFNHRSLGGLVLFSAMVSIDAFSVGVSLGMFASDLLLAVLLFGLFGGLLSVLGLLLGRRVNHWAGEYGEAFGGLILLLFGIKFLL
jgi:putative Mn2+ efflux pump MntP